MIPPGVKTFFAEWRVASLADLSVHFGVEPHAMRGMSEQWIRKAKFRKLLHGASCPSCCEACNSDELEIYEWLE